MIKKLQNYILKHHLPQVPSPLLVALSGGADSIALLLLLQEMGYALTAAHCNFHLRGKESMRDEKFVRNLCKARHIPLYVKDFETSAYAQQQNISIEMAARELRYLWFEDLRKEKKCVAIAVAHHADDNAETLLLNLVRGSGIHGLRGMLPKNKRIIRPLLCFRRHELEYYLRNQGQDFVTDSTNLETIYKRNKIRHQIIPELGKLNSNISEILSNTAQRLAEVEQLYEYAVQNLRKDICEDLIDGVRIHLEILRKSPSPSTLLHEYLTEYGFSSPEINMIYQRLNRPTGTTFSSKNYCAVVNRGTLEVRKKPQHLYPIQLPENGTLELSNGHCLHIQRISRKDLISIPKSKNKVALDTKSLQGKLFVGSIQEGERFHPYGMKGTKLISDYLTDLHYSIIDKQSALAVRDNQGIIWLVNERPDQRATITNSTLEVIILTYQ